MPESEGYLSNQLLGLEVYLLTTVAEEDDVGLFGASVDMDGLLAAFVADDANTHSPLYFNAIRREGVSECVCKSALSSVSALEEHVLFKGSKGSSYIADLVG
jgi:hypothetical protein